MVVEYASILPACSPLREPTTFTPETVVPGPPRKLIWVVGEASAVPGSGETVIEFTAAASTLATRIVLGIAAVVGAEDPQALSVTATSVTASAGASTRRR